jgi:hypothetical protein
MLKLVLGSAVIGVIIALGTSAVLRLLHLEVDSVIIGAVAGVGAGLYASSVRVRRERMRKS